MSEIEIIYNKLINIKKCTTQKINLKKIMFPAN